MCACPLGWDCRPDGLGKCDLRLSLSGQAARDRSPGVDHGPKGSRRLGAGQSCCRSQPSGCLMADELGGAGPGPGAEVEQTRCGAEKSCDLCFLS